MTIIIYVLHNINKHYLKIMFSDEISPNQENCERRS